MSILTIDADFPGGNIIVESIDGDTVTLRQDPRDTPIWWFYWAFRVRGAAGRAVTFRFTGGDVFGAMGPCYSPDGEAWHWLGREVLEEQSFSHTFPAEQDAGYFAFCIPYTLRHLSAYLAWRPQVLPMLLGLTEGGRPVPLLAVPSARGTQQVLVTARHHACESMANYEIEGLIDGWLIDPFLREHVDLHCVPFMDLDGVEAGDQGKARHPHDHNRDYLDNPRYATVRTLTAAWPAWRGAFPLMLDLHCPWIRGEANEVVLLVTPEGTVEATLGRFLDALHGAQTGLAVYDRRWLLRFGEEWNTEGETSTDYFTRVAGAGLALTLEFPYALVNGVPVTTDVARQFGRDLAGAVARYLQ